METQHFYYPLVAKTATISLLNFRRTSNLGFNGTFLKPHKHKQNSSQSGDYRVKHGNCQMTRSYRKVEPIVAKVSNLEHKCVQEVFMRNQSKFLLMFMIWAEYKCVSKIITAIATYLISQPKLQEMLAMAAMTMTINFLLVWWRATTPKFPPTWYMVLGLIIQFLPVHLNFLLMPKNSTVRYTIAVSLLGEALGLMALKAIRAHKSFSHRL